MNVILERKAPYIKPIINYTIIGLYQCIHDNNKPHINRVGIDVSYQQMKTDEITTPNYFNMDKQKRPTTTQEKQERGK